MMIHAYPETYLNSAMRNIGDMFDYAINYFGIPADDFVAMLLTSEICQKLENGESKYLIGMSGIELAMRLIEEKTGVEPLYDAADAEVFSSTPDHWCGWALCYYQWLRAIPYKRILEAIPYSDLRGMYRTLHEADISKFSDTVDAILKEQYTETNLKRIRSARGLSQSQLANKSGVSLRSIQMYEQRNKDINKGQAAALRSIAKTLGCSIENLLEPNF